MHNRHTSPLWPGVPLALGSAVLFGATAPLSKLLLGSVNAWVLAGILYLGAGIGLAAFQVLRRAIKRPSTEASIVLKDIPYLSAIVVFGGVLGPLLLMVGLSTTTGSSGSLLLNVEGLATMAIAWLVYGENVDRRLLIGAAAILAGAILLTWNGIQFEIDMGSMFVVGACLAWAIDNNLTRKLSAADPVQIATIKSLVAGSVNLVLALATGAHLPSAAIVISGALVGLLGVGVSLVMFMLSLRHLGTARTGAYFSTAPFIGAALSLPIFGEALTLKLLAAAALMGFGVWMHLTEQHRHEHEHEPLEHAHRHTHDVHHQHSHEGPNVEPHSHWHRHVPLRHSHPHYPDIHHRHTHG